MRSTLLLRHGCCASEGFRIWDEDIAQGIAETVWPGRIEKLQSNPEVYLDGAHNPSAARELATFWEENFAGRSIYLLYGALRDKAVDEVAGLLFPFAAEVIFTEPRTSRAISAAQLAEIAAHHAAHSSVIADPERALDYAISKAAPGDAVFVTGSLYLVGQLRHYWKQRTAGRGALRNTVECAVGKSPRNGAALHRVAWQKNAKVRIADPNREPPPQRPQYAPDRKACRLARGHWSASSWAPVRTGKPWSTSPTHSRTSVFHMKRASFPLTAPPICCSNTRRRLRGAALKSSSPLPEARPTCRA